jgi:serine/threonine protein kinase
MEVNFAKYLSAFREEAEALSGFSHPNIVEVFQRFDERGTSYFVMTFIEGASLGEVIRQHGALPTEGVMLIAERLMSAVRQIHANNRLHRDLNPNNIMLRLTAPPYSSRLPDIPDEIHARFGAPVVLDFGASREVPESGGTMTGIGTERFGAPEQLGSRGRQDVRTDIYGLGATFYACLAGEYPPSANERAHEDRLVPAAQRFAKKAPPGFLRAIDRALQLRPEYRPQSIEAFREELFSDFAIAGWSRPRDSFSQPGPGRYGGTGSSAPSEPTSSVDGRIAGNRTSKDWRLVSAGALAAMTIAVVVGGVQLLAPSDAGGAASSIATPSSIDTAASVEFLMRQMHASQSLYNELAQHKLNREDFARTPGLEDMAAQADRRIADIEQSMAKDRQEARALVHELALTRKTSPQDFEQDFVALEAEAKSQGRFDKINRLNNIRKFVIQHGQQKGVPQAEFDLFWSQEVEVLQ